MIRMDSNHCRIVTESITGKRKVDEHTFAAIDVDAFFTQYPIDFIADSVDLAVAVSTADNEVVSKGSHLSDIQHQDIDSLFVEGSLHSLLGYLRRFQN